METLLNALTGTRTLIDGALRILKEVHAASVEKKIMQLTTVDMDVRSHATPAKHRDIRPGAVVTGSTRTAAMKREPPPSSLPVPCTKWGDLPTYELLFLNPWSVCNKPGQIRDLIIDEDLDVLALAETWLWGTPQDNVILSDLLPNGYCIKNNARKNRRGGGTALIHRESLKIRSTPASERYASFEVLECCLSSSLLIRLYVIYRPPGLSTTSNFNDEFADLVSNVNYYSARPAIDYRRFQLSH